MTIFSIPVAGLGYKRFGILGTFFLVFSLYFRFCYLQSDKLFQDGAYFMKKIVILLFIALSTDILGQDGRNILEVKYGVTYIPLYIGRTDLIRWMVYPAFEVDYFLNEKIAINASYLFYDKRITDYDYEKDSKYSESPFTSSYEIAKENEGKKWSFSSFFDYVFCGVKYKHYTKKAHYLNSTWSIGFRRGETSVLRYAIENPSYPNGFEAITENMNSTGPGVKLGVAPGFLFWKILTVDLSVGTYVFVNWPVFQPYGNFSLGLSF